MGDVLIVLVDCFAVNALMFQELIKVLSDLAWALAGEFFATELHWTRFILLLQWLNARNCAKILLTIFLLYRIKRDSVTYSA